MTTKNLKKFGFIFLIFTAIFISFFSMSLFSCIPKLRDVYLDLSYPRLKQTELKPSRRNWKLSYATLLYPILLSGYRNPVQAGQCLENLSKRPDYIRKLWNFGYCLVNFPKIIGQQILPSQISFLLSDEEKARSYYYRWYFCLRELPGLEPYRTAGGSLGYRQNLFEGSSENLCQLTSQREQILFILSLASSGEIIYQYYTKIRGFFESKTLPARLASILSELFKTSGEILKFSPRKRAEYPNHPALALSGGAGNGAFTAGFLHALLSLRYYAIQSLRNKQGKGGGGQEQTPLNGELKTLENYRFGASAGTSVGSLITAIVDLYFTFPSPEDEQQLISACREYAHQDPRFSTAEIRDLQQCALFYLYREFTARQDWELLCVENGNALEVMIGQQKNILRFQPFVERILKPFFANYGEAISNNDFISVYIATDLEGKTVAGIDERICQFVPGERDLCLEKAILASISEPTFVPAVDSLFFGYQNGWEKGLWYDGGIRSGSPVSFAGLLTDGKVLNINTNRIDGIQGRNYPNGFSVLFGTLSDLVEQVRGWEIAYSSLLLEHRKLQRKIIKIALFGTAEKDLSGEKKRGLIPWQKNKLLSTDKKKLLHLMNHSFALKAALPLAGGNVLSLFVPEQVPSLLSAAGYSFYPYVMTGLFRWGQWTFLQNADKILDWLGWNKLKSYDRNPPEEWERYKKEVRREIRKYSWNEVRNGFVQRIEERREIVKKNMQICK